MIIGKKIKRSFSRFLKGERGQVLPMVLILLVLGSTIVAGTLTYGATSLKTSQVTQDRAEQLYSADAGVRYAIWQLTNFPAEFSLDLPLPPAVPPTPNHTYSIIENGKTVTVNIYCVVNVEYNRIYRITSKADGSDSSTTIEAYVSKIIDLWKNAASSGEGIDPPSCQLIEDGSIIIDGPTVPKVCADPPEEPYDTGDWPFLDDYLYDYYLDDVDLLLPDVINNDIDVDITRIIGPLWAQPPLQGGKYHLDIDNKGGDPTVVATLGAVEPPPWGTVFVEKPLQEAKLNIGLNSVSDFTLDLNRNTIYVEGSINIGGKCTIIGSGCIIATGDIYFTPNMLTTEDDFVFVLSLNGSVTFQPSGSFYGSVAGKDVIGIQPGNLLKLTKPPKEGVNFPTEGLGLNAVWVIDTWQINRTSGVVAAVLAVSTGSLPQGEVGRPYSKTLDATGGTEPYTWAVTVGSLPANLTLDPATGVISGTPAAGSEGNYPITVTVTDSVAATAPKPLTLTINPAPVITTLSLSGREVGVLYSETLAVSPGVGPYTWTWYNGDPLPLELPLSLAGVISGTPSTAATYNFSVQVLDSLGGDDIQPLSITVYPKVIISTASLLDGKKNKAYGAAGGIPVAPVFLMATPGYGTYTWSISAGSLPPNMSLNPATGQLTGNLKNADVGTWTITFRVTDSLGGTDTKALTIIVAN